ncbi:hypothetical protein CXB51_004834 [Gossypium anomalum]|uniref:Aminotransferase-like plant mobile domain-containing protein n=1 Tax=Gossypium anomalum TaxID=47600 RepID=A0A8J5ZVX9_9ROSI|nr:hypothetical protein CXB51_004834 [Gossypium anomalum]
MASLINKELSHICDTVNNTNSDRILRGRVNGVGYSPDARLMPYLELAGFGSVALTRTFDLRYDLISALVERWRPETHTFHLPCGECTVTLEDVALQFGLSIDGDAVTGVSTIAEPAVLCYGLRGASPDDAESTFSELKFTWLKANFQHLSNNATKEELVCAARAVRSYSWGSTVLAMLYRELCRMTKPNAIDMGGCLILLQSWALYRMPFLASSSGTTGIEYYDSLVASSISRIRQCRWGRRFTVRTREGDMDSIGGLCTGDLLRCGRVGWLEDLRWICLPICAHR